MRTILGIGRHCKLFITSLSRYANVHAIVDMAEMHRLSARVNVGRIHLAVNNVTV